MLQRQARAMGDPTRYQLFRFIADAGRPVPVKELVGEVGLHHTAVRQHLAVLRDAGLVVESTERLSGPGRPRLVYRTSVDAMTRWAGPTPYEQLSLMLLRMLDTGAEPREVGRVAGVVAASRVASGSAPEPAEGVVRELARLGFDPAAQPAGTGVDVVLRHCPMAEAAGRWPEIVCALHHGIVDGLAASLGAGTVGRFSPAEAHRAGCSFRIVPPEVAPPHVDPGGGQGPDDPGPSAIDEIFVK